MKNILSIFILGFFVLLGPLGLVGVAYAQEREIDVPGTVTSVKPTAGANRGGFNSALCRDGSLGKICNPIKAKSINELILSIVAIIKFIAGIVLVIFFILAGFKYVIAMGDEGKVKDAHRMLTATAIGGAILLGAEVIQRLIVGTINQLGVGL